VKTGRNRGIIVSLEISVERGRDEIDVRLKGAVDLDSIQQLQSELHRVLHDRPRVLVVDLTHAEVADAIGASTFELARSEADLAGVNLRLTNRSSQ
jgi:anti-anti-sigma regulatory factor